MMEPEKIVEALRGIIPDYQGTILDLGDGLFERKCRTDQKAVTAIAAVQAAVVLVERVKDMPPRLVQDWRRSEKWVSELLRAAHALAVEAQRVPELKEAAAKVFDVTAKSMGGLEWRD